MLDVPICFANAPTIFTKCASKDHSLTFSSQAVVLCAESNLPTYGISGKVGSTDVPRGEALHLLPALASLQQRNMRSGCPCSSNATGLRPGLCPLKAEKRCFPVQCSPMRPAPHCWGREQCPLQEGLTIPMHPDSRCST